MNISPCSSVFEEDNVNIQKIIRFFYSLAYLALCSRRAFKLSSSEIKA